MCRVHSFLVFLHIYAVKEQIFPSICLSCENHVALCDYHASLMHWLLPLCAKGLLDRCPLFLTCPGWCPSGWGSLPTGWGSLLAHRVLACPSYDDLGLVHLGLACTLFTICLGFACPILSFLFAVRVISQCTIDMIGSCLYPDLFPFTTGLYLSESCVLSPFTRSVPNLSS